MKPRLTIELINIEDISVPPAFNRWGDRQKDDEQLRRSVEVGGVQQPLNVVRDGETLHLVKGSRRIGAAKVCGIPKLLAVVDTVPEGQETESYIQRSRFIIDEHRQDLLPSQRAQLIRQLKEQMRLGNAEVAVYLGVDSDTVTNWLAPLRYIPEIQQSLDAGTLTMQAARVFVGLTPEGQHQILKRHRKELVGNTVKLHKKLRRDYPPEQYPKWYENPETTRKALRTALKAPPSRRKASGAPMAQAEKQRLLKSVELKEFQLEDYQAEEKRIRDECTAALPLVNAILRQPKLKAMVPEAMVEELEKFAEGSRAEPKT